MSRCCLTPAWLQAGKVYQIVISGYQPPSGPVQQGLMKLTLATLPVG
jgi:hypothetical protein